VSACAYRASVESVEILRFLQRASAPSLDARILVERRRSVALLSPKVAGLTTMKAIVRLLRDETGATAVEYGLIVAAIAGLIVLVVFVLGNKINNAFSNVAQAMP
jgi:pilus assembly protein Flp/PilA